MATAASSLSVESSVQSGRQLSCRPARNVCRSTLPSGMTLRPRKNPSMDQLIEKNPNFCIINCRIGVFWPSDNKYYRGTLKAFNEDTEKYRVLYDDDQKEEIDLDKDVFRWYGPKAISAGYVPLMKEEMIVFGAENVRTEKTRPPWENTATDLALLMQPKEVIGRRLFLYWDATGDQYEAEVLAYDSRRKLHYLWFRDGELEWVDLRKEVFYWVDSDSRLVKEFPAGLDEGNAIPRGKVAIGWRIAVYWPDDVQFYDGKITRYHGETGRHDVDYDDGTMETLSLSSEKIIWKTAPLTSAATSLDSSQSCSQKTSSTRKPTRGAVSSPKTKRPRLPSSPSSDLAKENHAELLEGVDSNEEMTTATATKTAPPPATTTTEPTPDASTVGGFLMELRPSLDEREETEMEEEEEEEEEEDFELYPVMQIPPEPLPAVQQTRLAKLPVRFGGGVFQVRILAATKPETTTAAEAALEDMCQVDQALACVNDYQSAMTKIGRMPSAIEVAAASKLLPNGPMAAEYPTKEMTGMDTVASRVGFPQHHHHQQQQHRKALPNRGRGRRKSRSTPAIKMDQGGTQTTLGSVLATLATPVPLPQMRPLELGQGVSSVSAATSDGASPAFDMDYSKNVFDVACRGKLPFVDLPSPTAFRLMQDNIGTAAAPGHSVRKKLDPSSNGDDPA